MRLHPSFSLVSMVVVVAACAAFGLGPACDPNGVPANLALGPACDPNGLRTSALETVLA